MEYRCQRRCTIVPCSGNTSISQEYLQEANIDVEWAGAVAPNATINYIYAAANDPALNETGTLQYAVQDYTVAGKVVPIVSYSFALCELQGSSSSISTFETVFKQAATQGQTIIASAGDAGSAACDDSNTAVITAAAHGLAVGYPASSTYVLAVGGTEFTSDGSPGQNQPSNYWNASNSMDAATNLVYSATGYIPEAVYNDSTYSIANGGGISAGGGGYSALFSRPSWQNLTPSSLVKNSGPRGVPDIAMAASSDHDPYLFYTQLLNLNPDNTVASTSGSYCQDGFYGANGDIYPIGGTSAEKRQLLS